MSLPANKLSVPHYNWTELIVRGTIQQRQGYSLFAVSAVGPEDGQGKNLLR